MPVIQVFYKGIIFLSALFIFNSHLAQAQRVKKAVNWMLHHSLIDTTTPGNPSFRIYPTLAYAPETDLEIGFSTVYLFQAKRDTNNRISELNAFTFFTLKSQYGIWIDNAIYGDKEKWFILGRTRFQRFPLLYYGVGPKTSKDYPAIFDANYLNVRQRVLRNIAPHLFFGPEVDYQNFFNTSLEHDDADDIKDVPAGSEGSSNIGLGAALVYDRRNNVLNVRDGHFAELGLLTNSRSLGSKFNFTGINTDLRLFHSMNKRDVLAWQLVGNFFTNNVPFNQMAFMGGETMMRGYYYGRFRDRNMLATQVEYRMLPLPFSKRIGATVFAATATVAPRISSFSLDNLKLSGGAGLRYLLFPKKDIFIRFDLGATKEGFGYYFFVGEAF